jgi:hypothetical protein
MFRNGVPCENCPTGEPTSRQLTLTARVSKFLISVKKTDVTLNVGPKFRIGKFDSANLRRFDRDLELQQALRPFCDQYSINEFDVPIGATRTTQAVGDVERLQ